MPPLDGSTTCPHLSKQRMTIHKYTQYKRERVIHGEGGFAKRLFWWCLALYNER